MADLFFFSLSRRETGSESPAAPRPWAPVRLRLLFAHAAPLLHVPALRWHACPCSACAVSVQPVVDEADLPSMVGAPVRHRHPRPHSRPVCRRPVRPCLARSSPARSSLAGSRPARHNRHAAVAVFAMCDSPCSRKHCAWLRSAFGCAVLVQAFANIPFIVALVQLVPRHRRPRHRRPRHLVRRDRTSLLHLVHDLRRHHTYRHRAAVVRRRRFAQFVTIVTCAQNGAHCGDLQNEMRCTCMLVAC